MKQELLACDRVFEAVGQPTPAEVVMVEVLGGDAVEAPLPALKAAVVGVDVLHMPDTATAAAVVARATKLPDSMRSFAATMG